MINNSCFPIKNHKFIPLNDETKFAPKANLDAVFIPTNRKSYVLLRQLEKIADSTDGVWLLSSGDASSFLYQNRHMFPENVLLLTDFPDKNMKQWFIELASSNNPSQRVNIDYDLPLKRNLAIQISKEVGYQRICLLDDDITITSHQIEVATSALCTENPLSGFLVLYYPDVSTLEHVHRITTGFPSKTMPGGNCLFLYVPRLVSFFPYIYNEDWLFIHLNLLSSSASLIGEVIHEPHAPWNDIARIQFEEFGELIIEGIFELPGGIRTSEALSEDYWRLMLEERSCWLTTLESFQERLEFLKAVQAARLMLSSLEASDCTQFITAFTHDTELKTCIPNLSNLLSLYPPPMG